MGANRKGGMAMSEERNGRRQGAGGQAQRLASAAEAYIDAHYTEKFSLLRIAGSLYVNGSYLLRVYRAETGRTLLWYHNHVRCERAKALLSAGRDEISSVGEKVGFVSSSHFSHVFRKMTGCTPSEYRKRSGPHPG